MNNTAGGSTTGSTMPHASQATVDAYAYLARVHSIVVETLPAVRRKVMMIDMVSQSTGSESMPGNVSLEIADMITMLQAMETRISDAAHGEAASAQ